MTEAWHWPGLSVEAAICATYPPGISMRSPPLPCEHWRAAKAGIAAKQQRKRMTDFMIDVSHYGRRITRLSSNPGSICERQKSHAIVIRPATALGWHPGNDLVRIHDVAGLAVHAIGR